MITTSDNIIFTIFFIVFLAVIFFNSPWWLVFALLALAVLYTQHPFFPVLGLLFDFSVVGLTSLPWTGFLIVVLFFLVKVVRPFIHLQEKKIYDYPII